MSTAPLLAIVRTEDLDAYNFAGINGGARLADGGEVGLDWSNSQMQKSPLAREQLWSRDRNGEWPGDFDYLYLTHGFVISAKPIVVYDVWTQRVSVLGRQGAFLEDFSLVYTGLLRREFSCTQTGGSGFG